MTLLLRGVVISCSEKDSMRVHLPSSQTGFMGKVANSRSYLTYQTDGGPKVLEGQKKGQQSRANKSSKYP
jgi:hypothetical protein